MICPTTTPPTIWKLARREIDLSRRPCIVGVLNVTPDSFSDGNHFFDVDSALERALVMEAEGADIIDVGGESTRPNATPVRPEEELARVLPVIKRLVGHLSVPISIDTYKADVAREALRAGADIVNDISALNFDPKMAEIVAAAKAGVVLVHTRGKPAEMQKNTSYDCIVTEVTASLRRSIESALNAGMTSEQIVVDPGIGFGKSINGNLDIIRHLAEFTVLGCPIMIGTSRKAFIGAALDRKVNDRLFGTAASVVVALTNGASLFRVHDIKEIRDVLNMAQVLLAPTMPFY